MSDDRELSALYQSAEKPQTSAALDKTIRAAARREAKPGRSHASQWFGGIAASLFAALLVTQLIPIEEPATPKAKRVAPQKLEAELARSIKPAMRLKSSTLDEADSAPPTRAVPIPEMMQLMSVPPQPDLQTIIDLLDAGKTREAEEQLALFRKRYPEATIPEEILTRLDKAMNSGQTR